MSLTRQQNIAVWLFDSDDEIRPMSTPLVAPSAQAPTLGVLPRHGIDPSPHAPTSAAMPPLVTGPSTQAATLRAQPPRVAGSSTHQPTSIVRPRASPTHTHASHAPPSHIVVAILASSHAALVASLAPPSDVVTAPAVATVDAAQTTTVDAAMAGTTTAIALSRKRGRHEDGSESRTPTRDGSVESDSSLGDGLVADTNWRVYIARYTRYGWPVEYGIINDMKRYTDGRPPAEGRRLKWCLETLGKLHNRGRRPVEHKIGLCYDAKVRWEYYTDEADSTWRPDWLLLVDRPCNRASAGFLEAGIIAVVFRTPEWRENSINYRRNDHGGTGPRDPRRANLPHYIYIAVRLY